MMVLIMDIESKHILYFSGLIQDYQNNSFPKQ